MSNGIIPDYYPTSPFGIEHGDFEKPGDHNFINKIDPEEHVFKSNYDLNRIEGEIQKAMERLLEGGVQFKNEKNVGKNKKGNTK